MILARITLDLPTSRADLSDRIGRAMVRHETPIAVALLLGCFVEIWICVVRSAALWGGP